MEKSSSRRFQTICVFGGSSFGKDPEFVREACSLGKLLATKKIKLVYGESSGLMECVVRTALMAQGKVLGIIPKNLVDVNLRGPTLGDEIKVPNMHEQMAAMVYNSDAFIALPGGLKTLEGIFSDCYSQGFVKPMAHALIVADKSAKELIDKMEDCVPFSDLTLSKQEGGASSSGKDEVDTTLKLFF